MNRSGVGHGEGALSRLLFPIILVVLASAAAVGLLRMRGPKTAEPGRDGNPSIAEAGNRAVAVTFQGEPGDGEGSAPAEPQRKVAKPAGRRDFEEERITHLCKLLDEVADDPPSFFKTLNSFPREFVDFYLAKTRLPDELVLTGIEPGEFFRSAPIADVDAVARNLGRLYASASREDRAKRFDAAGTLPEEAARLAYRAAFAKSWLRADVTAALKHISGAVDWKDEGNAELRETLLSELARWKDEELLGEWRKFLGE